MGSTVHLSRRSIEATRMKVAVLSLMVILAHASAHAVYRKPFTAFQNPMNLGFRTYFAKPRYIILSSGYDNAVAATSQKQSFGPSQSFSPRNSFTRGVIPNNEFTSGSLVQNTKAQAEAAVELLKSFEGSDIAAQYIEPIFATTDCIDGIPAAISLIEEGAKIVADNAPELVYLEALVENLRGEKDILKLLKGSSKMLRTLDNLIPNIVSPSSCLTDPESSVKAFQDLGAALKEINNNPNLNVPLSGKGLLDYSATVMIETTEFLKTMNTNLNAFETICRSGTKDQAAIYDTIINIMDSLASLFGVLGFEDKEADIQKQGAFIRKIVIEFEDLQLLNLDIECSLNGSYSDLAQLHDDLAKIVEEVGVEKLSTELGVDLSAFNSL